MKLLTTLTVLFFSAFSIAAVYEGEIQKNHTTTYVILKPENKKYQLKNTTSVIAIQLNKLSTGDFISVEGLINTEKSIITVKSINYVGLRSLLGSWVGSEPYCFNFITHNVFNVTRKINDRCSQELASVYTYIINPDSQSWVFLVSGEYNSYVGDIHLLNGQSLEIDLYDSETGAILRQLSLRKYNSENISNTK